MSKIIGKIFAAEQTPLPVDPAPGAAVQDAVPDGSGPIAEKPQEKIRCGHCGKEYKTEKGLAEHMAKEHPLDILPEEPGEN